VTTDPLVVYTSNVFALLGMRALYFLLAGAASRLRYLRPGLAVILGAIAVKLLLADVWELPAWSAPAFIAAVLAVVAIASARDRHRTASPALDSPVTGGRSIAITPKAASERTADHDEDRRRRPVHGSVE
jgi:hypothetical protein